MTLEQYLAQRKEMLNAADQLIGEGKFEESESKMNEVKELDSKWESIKTAKANLKALNDDPKIEPLESKSISVEESKVIDNNKAPKIDDAQTYVNAWAKHMMGQDLSKDERQSFALVNKLSNEFTHTTINTPTLIPDTVVAGIEKLMTEQYPLLSDVRKFNVSGNLTMNRHASIEAGDAAWYTEPVKVEDEENTFTQFTLSGHELAKAVTVSWKMKSMAVSEFIPFIQQEIADRMGISKAVGVASGSGTNEPRGIVTALAAESGTPQIVEYTDSPDYDDIVDGISRIHSSLLGNVSIYANNTTIWNRLATLKDGEGRPLFIPDPTSGGVGRMFGFVVKADGSMTNGDVLIGNADKGYILNTNEPMRMVTQDRAKE